MRDSVAAPPLAELIGSSEPLTIGSSAVDRLVHAIRMHLDMDVAFVSEFKDANRVFRHVDACDRTPIHRGDSFSNDQGYCQRIADGNLPGFIPDTAGVAAAMALPETRAIPIGAHLSVPIRLADGRIYGMLCCFSFVPDDSLRERDLKMMKIFAMLIAEQVDNDLQCERTLTERRARITKALAEGDPSIVFQPIYDLGSSAIVGLECPSRFNAEPLRPTVDWFEEAEQVGMSAELELAAIRTALRALPSVPANAYLALNCSPQTVMTRELQSLLHSVELHRVVLELTEHQFIADYPQLLAALTSLRNLGMRVAIDDAGAGYASLRHVLQIQPDFIKLDISLTRHIDTDAKRRALASALIAFARETGAHIIAEGVETRDELATLKRLGASFAQGFYLAEPTSLVDALRAPFPAFRRGSEEPLARDPLARISEH